MGAELNITGHCKGHPVTCPGIPRMTVMCWMDELLVDLSSQQPVFPD
jgi:hypothetical protein